MSGNCITCSQPGIHILHLKSCSFPMRACHVKNSSSGYAYASFNQGAVSLLKYDRHKTPSRHQQCSPVCLFGGKGKTDANNGGSSPWKVFEDAIGNFKKGKSVEDLLRQQIEKKEFYDGGGSSTPPRGGGGGGGGGDGGSGVGDGLTGPEDEGFAGIIDETVQVVLATLGFIIVYLYIINGDEMLRLVKDYLKYLSGGGTTIRLEQAMLVWGRLVKRLREKKVPHYYYYENPEWLAQMIVETPTWWHHPEQERHVIREQPKESYSEEEEEEEEEEDDNQGEEEED